MPENTVVSNLKKPDIPMTVPVPKPEEIHYRVIQDNELTILHPLFHKLGWAMPDPNMCKVVVAEAGESQEALICGLAMVQFIPHAEPMWVNPDMRGTGVAEGLAETVQ